MTRGTGITQKVTWWLFPCNTKAALNVLRTFREGMVLICSVEGQEKPFELDPNEECELDKGEMLSRQSAPKTGIDVIN